MKSYIAEAIGTFALIFIGVGAILNQPFGGDLLMVALAHGLTIAVLASATAGISGGHLNPAVTFGAWVGGKISAVEAAKYIGAQLIGAVLAGLLLSYIFGQGVVIQGTPALSKVTYFKAILLEAVTTFFLVLVVYGTAIDARGPKIGALAIGLTVTIGILVAGPFTGGALNPARAFGPSLATWSFFANFKEQLIYWIGPLFGGGLAGLLYGRYLIKP
jgi:MIP family channel proteins